MVMKGRIVRNGLFRSIKKQLFLHSMAPGGKRAHVHE